MNGLGAKHLTAVNNIRFKIDAINKMLNDGLYSLWDGRPSFDQFCKWEDEKSGIIRCSKSNFTPKPGLIEQNEVYASLKNEIVEALSLLSEGLKNKGKKKSVSRDVNELNLKIKALEKKCQNYVNDYTAAMAELVETKSDLQRAKERISRLESKQRSGSNIISLK